MIKKIINRILFKYIHQHWNIAIADFSDNFIPYNIKWMKHEYHDRWFADPFIIKEDEHSYIILVEEFIRDSKKGRLAKLTVGKGNFELIKNETILDIDSHLSFPNSLILDKRYIFPENSQSGTLQYYSINNGRLEKKNIIVDMPLADATIFEHKGTWYLLATIGDNCNGNILSVFKSNLPLQDYHLIQQIEFKDNIARRAGNVFEFKGILYSPAQVCNKDYGEAVSIQEIKINSNDITVNEIKRLMPQSKKYKHGFHTFNVWSNKVIIDGYYYMCPFLRTLYYKFRKLIG